MIIKVRSLLVALALACSLTACGGGNKAADAFMNDYEKIVISAEAKAGSATVSPADLQDLGKQGADLGQKAAALQTSGAWSESQAKRYTGLSKRYSEAVTKMSQKAMQQPPK